MSNPPKSLHPVPHPHHTIAPILILAEISISGCHKEEGDQQRQLGQHPRGPHLLGLSRAHGERVERGWARAPLVPSRLRRSRFGPSARAFTPHGTSGRAILRDVCATRPRHLVPQRREAVWSRALLGPGLFKRRGPVSPGFSAPHRLSSESARAVSLLFPGYGEKREPGVCDLRRSVCDIRGIADRGLSKADDFWGTGCGGCPGDCKIDAAVEDRNSTFNSLD
jgi:hypothetical protein